MKHWKLLVPVAILAVMAMGAGCAGTGRETVGAKTEVDASVDAIVNASSEEGQNAASEDANAEAVTDTSSLTNLGNSYDPNKF